MDGASNRADRDTRWDLQLLEQNAVLERHTHIAHRRCKRLLDSVAPARLPQVGDLMQTTDISGALTRLFSELVDGAGGGTGAFILNSGDGGLLRSLDKLSAAEASRSVNDGATIAAHAQHVRYGLSLMNRWATAGGDPFADATWDEAWKTVDVDAPTWKEIRNGLREEATRWLTVLSARRDVSEMELTGMIASIAHLVYHLGAIRQIAKDARGPREGTFS
jgi:hypothetical protein